jgi:hypothetical protein
VSKKPEITTEPIHEENTTDRNLKETGEASNAGNSTEKIQVQIEKLPTDSALEILSDGMRPF